MHRLQPLASRARHLAHSFIIHRWLALGYLVLLTGLFWAPSGSQFTKFYYGMMAFPALLALLIEPRQLAILLREPLILSFLAFAGWMLLSLLWSQTDNALGGLAKRPLYVLMLFAGCALLAGTDGMRLTLLLRVGAALAALAALISLGLFYFEASAGGRLVGTGGLHNPLLSSHVFGFFCTYWIAAWLTRSERRQWLPILLSLILLTALLATGSRTPLLALGMTSLWMLVMTRRRAMWLLLAMLLLTAASLLLTPEILLQRGTSYRPELWADALRQAGDHPWVGRGFNSPFLVAVPALLGLSDPHNVELAVLLELGIIGLSLWLLLYGLTLWRCLQHRHDSRFQLASALVVYGFSAGLTEGSNFLSRPNENWFLIWIPLSLVAALSISHRRQSSL